MKRLQWLIALMMLASACAPRVNQISTRNPDLFEKESDRMQGQSRGTQASTAPDLFVRDRRPVIRQADRPNETGSLYNPDDERNYLFSPTGPQNVGRFLTVNIVAGRGPAPKPEAASAEAKPDVTADQEEAEMLKGLPDLTPAKKGDPALQRSFKMRIVHRFENGDVLARLDRRSQSGEDARTVTAEARIPYDRLAAGDGLTTEDLLDVKFLQSGEEELVERTSSGWEDEYSLRLSGFDEAKSKLAMDLVDQKKQLEDAKTSLETRIKTFGDERRQVAKQRDDLIKKNSETDVKVKEMEDTINDQKDTISSQQEEIASLKPENKPGDDKESGE